MSTSVFCWGNTSNGELGLGGIEETCINSPTRWKNFLMEKDVVDIACGKNHTLVLLNDGTVFSCGKNDMGQLGHNESQFRLEQIKALQMHHIQQIRCGNNHNLVLNEAGQIFSWGSNNYGQLGLACEEESIPLPRMVKRLAVFTVIQISCGAHHSLALTNVGELYSWGYNNYGQLGIGNNNNQNAPCLVVSLLGVPINYIAAGGNHNCILTKSGGLFSWGRNTFGQLGLNDDQDRFFPVNQKSLRSHYIKYISCGEDHTACLTKEGGVFTFGAGMFGQLGHGSKSNEILPRKVLELMGSVVTQISCGRCHTLTYVPRGNRIYVFGLNGSGQLGLGNLENRTVPLVISDFTSKERGNSPTSNNIQNEKTENETKKARSNSPFREDEKNLDDKKQYQINKIISGGDQSFVLTIHISYQLPSKDFRIFNENFQILSLENNFLQEIQDVKADDCVPQDLMSYIENVFSSSSCLNGSYLESGDRHYDCSAKNHGIDIDTAECGFNYVRNAENSTISELVGYCLENLLPNLSNKPPDVEAIRLYLLLPLCHLFEDPKQYLKSLIVPFGTSLLQLNHTALKIIELWWTSLNTAYFRKLVQIYKSVIVYLLQLLDSSSDGRAIVYSHKEVMRLSLNMLRLLNKVNIDNRELIPYQEFYISEVTEKVDIRYDYAEWLESPHRQGRLYFCDYPFVFDAAAKTLILQTDSAIRMESAMNSAFQQNLVSAFIPVAPTNPFLVLYVTRDNLLQETINQLSKYDQQDLKKPLKVIFHGEDAVDAGGVRKEFFMLLLREALDPKYGMFTEHPETRCIWFHAKTFSEDNQLFYLIGILCGLAIYNFTIIDLPFPLILYKKLLHENVCLEDLKQLSPTIAKSLQELLDYEDDDVEDVFVLNFEISLEMYGARVFFELKPNGKDIPVTKENRKEYVDCYVDFMLNKSVEEAFKSFADGFYKVCGSKVLEVFHAQELMALVVGTEEYDWKELEKNSEYKNEYDENHPAIKKFWKVFHSLTLEQKKKFLLFLTGSDRIPILGMKAVKITFQPMHVTDDHLPVAHTCFNILDLPHYTTEEALRTKLLQAIEHTQGFGLA